MKGKTKNLPVYPHILNGVFVDYDSVSPGELFWPVTGLVLRSLPKTRLFKYIENFTSKTENFQIKILKFFFVFLLKNIDCGYSLEPPRRGGSNEYPQSMFSSRNKKNNIYPVKPNYIKSGV